ncbi:hypothetical protein ACJMQP_04155 [Rhodopseudomonas palustris]
MPGVSARGVAYILSRFPEVRQMLTGQKVELNLDTLFERAPDAVAAIIAAGTGSPGDLSAEMVADQLPAAAQLELLLAIREVSMPKGIGPFVEAFEALFADGGPSNIPVTKSPQPSNT